MIAVLRSLKLESDLHICLHQGSQCAPGKRVLLHGAAALLQRRSDDLLDVAGGSGRDIGSGRCIGLQGSIPGLDGVNSFIRQRLPPRWNAAASRVAAGGCRDIFLSHRRWSAAARWSSAGGVAASGRHGIRREAVFSLIQRVRRQVLSCRLLYMTGAFQSVSAFGRASNTVGTPRTTLAHASRPPAALTGTALTGTALTGTALTGATLTGPMHRMADLPCRAHFITRVQAKPSC